MGILAVSDSFCGCEVSLPKSIQNLEGINDKQKLHLAHIFMKSEIQKTLDDCFKKMKRSIQFFDGDHNVDELHWRANMTRDLFVHYVSVLKSAEIIYLLEYEDKLCSDFVTLLPGKQI